MNKDLYKILDCSPNDDINIIKKKFRKLSLKYHPDKNNNDKEFFKLLNTAYKTLSDPDKKKHYDSLYIKINNSTITNENNNYNNNSEQINNTNNNNNNNLNNKVNNYNYINNQIIPNEIITKLNITLEQSYNGGIIPFIIERYIIINKNNVNIKQNETEQIYITIPKGIDTNEIIMLKNKGNIENNIQGDIKININIINDTIFKRDGINLLLNKEITLKESLCGFSFNIKNIDGKNFNIKINSGTIIQPNSTKRIKNMGMKRDDFIGDLIIIFKIIFPCSLENDQICKLKEIL